MDRIARFLHISDVHLGAFSEDPVRRQDVADAFARALSHAATEQADFVVLAGDLFDRKVVSPDVLHDHARAALERLRDASIPVFAIEGNHDEATHGARHSWVTYLGTEGLLVPLRPVLSPEPAWPADQTAERPAGRAVAPGGIPIYGMGYLGPRTDELLRALPDLVPGLGAETPSIVLLHAMRSPVQAAEPGTFTDSALSGLTGRNLYLALGHGHRRTISAGIEAPSRFVVASPGSLEYIHETDFHLEDPRGAILVDVLESGVFSVRPIDTLKRPRCVVVADLAALLGPEGLHDAVLARCRELGVPSRAILGVRLAGEPPFSKSQLPVPALERRLREELAPVSLDVRFDEPGELAPLAEPGRADDVASTLAGALRERAKDVAPEVVDRVAAFVAPRVGDGGAWRSCEDESELEDALGVLLDLVAGPQAPGVRELLAELPKEPPWSS